MTKATGRARITSDPSSDIVWGARDISVVIGRSERATFHLLEQGLLPARKVGGVWAGSKQKLLAHFTGDATP
jgi:hypothetical protein